MTKHSLNINETVVLLGAGASAEAGIMTSADMLNHIEAKVRSDPDWERFKDLYFLVKGYSTGAAIAFPNSSRTVFHVESLVDILQGIDGIHLSLLYPFLGGWAPPLESICRQNPGLAGESFLVRFFLRCESCSHREKSLHQRILSLLGRLHANQDSRFEYSASIMTCVLRRHARSIEFKGIWRRNRRCY